MDKELLDYFSGDELAASVWLGKYALKNEKGEYVEKTPADMHWRMSQELARVEASYGKHINKDVKKLLSSHGLWFHDAFWNHVTGFPADFIYTYLDRFKYIIPQGSIMSALGNTYKLQSLSNCFVVPAPEDSYGGIFKTDQEIAQLEKRRGGVGTNLNKLAPEGRPVLNAAGTSTGAHSFMPRYSNTTREVAQNGRRGALMLLLLICHPDIFKFVTKKKDRTQVTGANISVQITNEFMRAVEADEDFICRFPVDSTPSTDREHLDLLPYNEIVDVSQGDRMVVHDAKYIMKIRAKELYDLIIEMAWDNAEPGLAFMDNVISYSPDGVYKEFMAIASNPCGEQWMQAYDACRLLAMLLYSFVVNPFTPEAYIDFEKLKEVSYVQQRLGDVIVDLEIEYVQRIIDKINRDPESDDIKATELNLWKNVQKTAKASRRTGCGITGLADMLAALGLKYDSDEALLVIREVMKTKMEGELEATIDLANLRGTFEGWNRDLEFTQQNYKTESIFDENNNLKNSINSTFEIVGANTFYQTLIDEFPEQVKRMYLHGRRNVSWSTIAPTGSLSIMAILSTFCNVSGGMEPVFFPYYFRNKKVNPSDGNVRVDSVDQNGDSWQTYPVVMGGFKEWYYKHPLRKENGFSRVVKSEEGIPIDYEYEIYSIEDLTKEQLDELYKASPYFNATANDISWEKRIEIQSILQRYTTNAISSTLNLPSNVSKETVSEIYKKAWHLGLKGVTVYRDGCRTGVLVKDNVQKIEEFSYRDAIKRPKELDGELHTLSVKGTRYGVVIGKLNGNPYELFAFELPDDVKSGCHGKIVKVKKGSYSFVCEDGTLKDLQLAALRKDEQVLSRLVSGMLRHGAKPQFIMEQIDKCELEVVSFGKAITRILKKYCVEEELVSRAKCSDCGSTNLRMQESCLTCNSCGSSKCG